MCNSRGSGNAIVHSVCRFKQHRSIDCCTKMFQWPIFVAGKNKTYVGFVVKCSLLL
jgi:hypothetical protein